MIEVNKHSLVTELHNYINRRPQNKPNELSCTNQIKIRLIRLGFTYGVVRVGSKFLCVSQCTCDIIAQQTISIQRHLVCLDITYYRALQSKACLLARAFGYENFKLLNSFATFLRSQN